MNKVHVLPPDVIAKIAAGEVVDRPASVVKELLENSIDAGAAIIEIHLKDAGKELIHIKDNGCGISRGDIERLFQRHATSKIQNIEDLEALASMGFRGEALYSIAAVADIALRSQTAGAKEAWSVHVRAGQRLDLAPAAPSGAGTDIQIRELFFNTPARRKFLKSNASEINHITGIIVPYALIYPDKRFVLTHAGRSLLDFQPASSRLDRAAAALSLEEKHFLQVSHNYPQEQMSVKAILGNINIQRPRRDTQYIFINGRPVEHKALSFTMNDVYRAVFPPGIYPVFILDIHVDPANVDVNIHPAKREVKIKDEAKLCSMVRHLSEDTLMRYGEAKSMEAGPASFYQPASMINEPPGTDFFGQLPDLFKNAGTTLPAAFQAPSGGDLRTKFAGARFIGSFVRKYLLFEEGTSLFLVDQHAAQERIMFEQFHKQIETGKVEVQHLLTPVLIKFSIPERVAWDEAGEKLKEFGIETALFDEETLAVHTQPVLLKNIENAVRTLLSGNDIARCDRATIARRACKASIVAGDALNPQQADYQRRQLIACQDPFTCPHGRPTVVELKENFLDKQFMRI
ncbi:MAG: DNA mismatch repair endonuclease MutL [Candidatus Omnitrophica bacterium]|nr:DNA mismatch repair endonuclease MutL [Candidatus Omnitrophota bacterium]